MSFPDFLCIGAQKAGTTWLDTNLRNHHELWLPPAKEIHYFDRELSPYILNLFERDPIQRYQVLTRFRLAFRDIVLRLIKPRECLYTIGWYIRFIFWLRSDNWYRSLFAPAQGQFAGEVTPGYSKLSDKEVLKIQKLMPEAKIIYLIRNPVDRIWSQTAMHFSKYGNRGLETIEHETIREFLNKPSVTHHSCYTETLAIWEKYFSVEQIFVGFFEQIAQYPQSLLFDLFRFLNVPADQRNISPNVTKKVFANKNYPQMPPDLSLEVTSRLYPEIVAMHERFGNQYTEAWLISAQNTIGNE